MKLLGALVAASALVLSAEAFVGRPGMWCMQAARGVIDSELKGLCALADALIDHSTCPNRIHRGR